MVQNSESDYRLLPSFITLTRLILNLENHNLKSFKHAIVIAHNPTDWRFHHVQPANVFLFHKHGLNSIKYSVVPNKIPTL